MIILLICIFLVLVVICVQLHRVFRLFSSIAPYIKYPKYTGGTNTLEGFVDTNVKDVRKTLDSKIAQSVVTKKESEEQFESYTENLGEDIIISDK